MTRLPAWQLFALAVLIWGTTWHAITYQLGGTPPEWGVALRFSLAAAVVLAFAGWRGERLRYGLRAHGLLALQGVFMYGLAYVCVYHAELHVPSGLVAVGYSASPVLMGLGGWALWRTPVGARFLLGGVLGVAGVALIFWPELADMGARPSAGLGLLFTVGAVLLSAVGALAASRNAKAGLPFWPALGWGLAWGAVTATLIAAASQPLPDPWPTAWSWWLSLAYLAVAGTVVAFAAFLTLQLRLGPSKASTVGVMTPVVALAVSTLFEGYVPSVFTLAGVALTIAGNVLMLRR
ncbi:MAG: DMT family transporter [Rubrivivax sp.]|nr:DMT family transporter [Rubrivivax sp.]